jgi:hypothetical protein
VAAGIWPLRDLFLKLQGAAVNVGQAVEALSGAAELIAEKASWNLSE